MNGRLPALMSSFGGRRRTEVRMKSRKIAWAALALALVAGAVPADDMPWASEWWEVIVWERGPTVYYRGDSGDVSLSVSCFYPLLSRRVIKISGMDFGVEKNTSTRDTYREVSLAGTGTKDLEVDHDVDGTLIRDMPYMFDGAASIAFDGRWEVGRWADGSLTPFELKARFINDFVSRMRTAPRGSVLYIETATGSEYRWKLDGFAEAWDRTHCSRR